MPTKSYREDFLKKLEDPDYSSLYIETAIEETIKDGDIRAFQRALRNVLEAAENRKESVLDIYQSRQCVYQALSEKKDLTVAVAKTALETVGIVPQEKSEESIESQLVMP